MHRMKHMWLLGTVMLLAATLLAPGLAQAQAKPGSPQGMQTEKMAKDLGLSPQQTKFFLMVREKYGKMRQGIIEVIQKNEGELEKALAAPKPNAAQIKGLVTTITSSHDKLMETFRGQRLQEMDLLNPIQQGKFLLALKKWHQQMCVKYDQQEKKK